MFLIHQPDFTFARILEHLISSRDLLKQRHIKKKQERFIAARRLGVIMTPFIKRLVT